MAKLLSGVLAAAAALGGAPALAEEGWSEFHDERRYRNRPYVYFVPGDFGRSGRFVSWDDGYFAYGGGVEVRNNQALYDYDRDYPYEYRSHRMAAHDEEEQEFAVQSCLVELVRDSQTGGTTDVRVCRN